MDILINIVLAIYVIVSLLMLLVILMQRPKSEGLGAAFGGGVTENIFGAQTTNVLTKATAWLAGIFFLLTFLLSILYANRSMRSSTLRRELMKTEAAKTAVPAPTAQPTSPTSAVGAPGTVTNPTPAAAETGASPSAADLAVGQAPAATAAPTAPAPTTPAPSP